MSALALATPVLAGTWHNTNAGGRVSRITIDDGSVETPEWGRVPAGLYAESFGDAPTAFSARFAPAGLDVRLQANIKGGVLVVAYFIRFVDESGRSPFFCREFYWQEVTP